MKKLLSGWSILLIATFAYAQPIPQKYSELVKQADSLYKTKDYKNAAIMYSAAFKANAWKGFLTDRYNAACSWSLTGVPDSAFFQLNRIVTKMDYTNYDHISTDPDLVSLHTDKRWKPLLEIVRKNKAKVEANYNRPLIAMLDTVFFDDQTYRHQIEEVEKRYGWESIEMKVIWNNMREKDSINLMKVRSI